VLAVHSVVDVLVLNDRAVAFTELFGIRVGSVGEEVDLLKELEEVELG
jgi:hypothetical protein